MCKNDSLTDKELPKRRTRLRSVFLENDALVCVEATNKPLDVDADIMLGLIRRHRVGLPGELTDRLISSAKGKERLG